MKHFEIFNHLIFIRLSTHQMFVQALSTAVCSSPGAALFLSSYPDQDIFSPLTTPLPIWTLEPPPTPPTSPTPRPDSHPQFCMPLLVPLKLHDHGCGPGNVCMCPERIWLVKLAVILLVFTHFQLLST